ncbi:MAG: hypothetical protein NZ898_01450 [Myxococcota bacterium]|nr:hypothetical protein [Myxococcota bacterium]MDW8362507.1 hypothetical protein [Myxococcales bacterium]
MRLVATLGTVFRPSYFAAAMARSSVRPAIRFALLSWTLPAALRGVIPYTFTLRFGDGFRIEPVATPTGQAIAFDVLRATGLSLLVSAAHFAALALPYVSLARAFGSSWARTAAWRQMLYRAWLLPWTVQGLTMHLGAWGLSASSPAWAFRLVELADALLLVVVLVSMRATARIACGVGHAASLAVVFVPAALLLVVDGLLDAALAPFVPAPPSHP